MDPVHLITDVNGLVDVTSWQETELARHIPEMDLERRLRAALGDRMAFHREEGNHE